MAVDPPPQSRRTSRARRWATWLLIVLTAIAAVVTTVSIWTHRTLVDSDAFVANVSGPAFRDPAVVEAISVGLADRIFTGLDVEGRLQARLPEALRPLAPPLVSAVEDRVQRQLEATLSTPEAQAAWDRASRALHDQLVAIIRGDSSVVVSQDGTLYLDLSSLLTGILTRLQTAGIIDASIAIPDFSTFETPERVDAWLQTELGVAPGTQLALVPIGSAAAVERAGTYLHWFDVLVVVLILVTFGLGVLAIALALDRTIALVELAGALAIGFVVSVLVIGGLHDWLIDQFSGGTLATVGLATVGAALDDVASWLRFLVGISVTVAAVVYLLSGPAWLRAVPATRTGRWMAANVGLMRALGLLVPLALLLVLPGSVAVTIAIVALAVTYQILLTDLARQVPEAATAPSTAERSSTVNTGAR